MCSHKGTGMPDAAGNGGGLPSLICVPYALEHLQCVLSGHLVTRPGQPSLGKRGRPALAGPRGLVQGLGGGAWGGEPCALKRTRGLVGHLEEGRGSEHFLVPSDLPELPGSLVLCSVPTEDGPAVLGVTGSLVPSLGESARPVVLWCRGEIQGFLCLTKSRTFVLGYKFGFCTLDLSQEGPRKTDLSAAEAALLTQA